MATDTDPYTHFLGGNPMNRLSWLRNSSRFLNAATQSPNARWVLFNAGGPLVSSQKDVAADSQGSGHVGKSRSRPLAFLSTLDVKPILGETPYFGQGEKEGVDPPPGVSVLEGARFRGPEVVFLGVLESPDSPFPLPSTEQDTKDEVEIVGEPYFVVDVTRLQPKQVEDVLVDAAGRAGNNVIFDFAEPRKASSAFEPTQAAIFAQARSMIDWNVRNKYCPACGSKNYSLWGGWKLNCTSLVPWADNTGRSPCPSGKGLQNFTHPRTDIAVITAVIDETGDKILLGRNKKFPGVMYSTLAGFIEPGESLEEAVRREIYEESGIRVTNVVYHSCQPWPYPANLMVGCYARADSSQVIRLDIDNELADARWFSREEVLATLAHPNGTRIRGTEYKKFDQTDAGASAQPERPPTPIDRPPFTVPPTTAIAGVLISGWAHRKAKL